MVDGIERAIVGKPGLVRRDRWGLLVVVAGLAAGAAIGLGLPALVAYQLRADPVDMPAEWRTTAGQMPAPVPAERGIGFEPTDSDHAPLR